MKNYLFFDTETTGFVLKNEPHNSPKQARCVQLAGILTNDAGEVINEFNCILKPDGWSVPDRVAEIHGISTEKANKYGLPAQLVFPLFNALADLATVVVAHNNDYDHSIMEIESLNYPVFMWRPIERRCTMKEATEFCAIPSARGGYKWPKLQELHNKLFGVSFEDAHDAMADVRATVRCFFELQKRGLIR